MKKEEIITKVQSLHFPENSYIVFGSGPLAVVGLREAQDIDFLVSEELFSQLKNTGWEELDKGGIDRPLVYDCFEAHDNWNFSSYSPTLEKLLSSAFVIEGIPFASLEEVRAWKLASGRLKDTADITLIDQFLKNASKEL